jgi:hypothetical protein
VEETDRQLQDGKWVERDLAAVPPPPARPSFW